MIYPTMWLGKDGKTHLYDNYDFKKDEYTDKMINGNKALCGAEIVECKEGIDEDNLCENCEKILDNMMDII